MAYCTQAEVEQQAGGPERLRQLADYDRNATADSDVVSSAIAEADRFIDSYARHRYSVPFAPVPDAIRDVSAEHAVYVLRKRRSMLNEDDVEIHKARIDWLTKLSKGGVTVQDSAGAQPATSEHVRAAAGARPDAKDVSRARLKGFW